MEGLVSVNRYHSRTSITEKTAIELANMPMLETIQFHDIKPDAGTLYALNDIVFKNRKDITLRVYGYSGLWQDISFLKQLPELEKFDWDSDEFQSYGPLYHLKSLKHLGLGFAIPKHKISIKFLTDFKDTLRSVNLLGDYNDLTTTISKLLNLDTVWFASTKLTGFDFLEGLNIAKLGNYGSRVKSFDYIGNIKSLKQLWIKTNTTLNHIDFVSELPLLKELEIYYLSKITTIPKCSHLKHFKKLIAVECNRLVNIDEAKTLMNCQVSIYGKLIPGKHFKSEP